MMPNHFFPFATQVDIMITCSIIQNWIIQDGGDEFIIEESNDWPNRSHATSSSSQASENAFMVNLRQEIADQMWQYHQNHYAN
jgi:hypothetical protein